MTDKDMLHLIISHVAQGRLWILLEMPPSGPRARGFPRGKKVGSTEAGRILWLYRPSALLAWVERQGGPTAKQAVELLQKESREKPKLELVPDIEEQESAPLESQPLAVGSAE